MWVRSPKSSLKFAGISYQVALFCYGLALCLSVDFPFIVSISIRSLSVINNVRIACL
jgi:hypothetical protein